MKEENGYFSSFDGTQLFYRSWKADAPNALFILHGIGEHSERYLELAESLSLLPLSIFIHDLRGHGRSEGERVYVESFNQFIDDIYQFRAFIEAKTGPFAKPPILLGHSLGGLIAFLAALRSQKSWRALILMSPYFAVPACDPLLGGIARLLNLIAPKFVWNNPVKPVFLTHDSEEITRYKTDPFIQRRITSRLAKEMFDACSRAYAKAHELALPLFVLASGEDKIVSLRKTKEIFERAASHDKMLRVFDGFYHELFHERQRQKPISVLKECLIKTIG